MNIIIPESIDEIHTYELSSLGRDVVLLLLKLRSDKKWLLLKPGKEDFLQFTFIGLGCYAAFSEDLFAEKTRVRLTEAKMPTCEGCLPTNLKMAQYIFIVSYIVSLVFSNFFIAKQLKNKQKGSNTVKLVI